MHSLEKSNIPIIGNLMQDVALALDGSQQYSLAVWTMKMAMVGEFISRSQRPMFYHKTDCEQLRVASNLPMNTNVWIARHSFPKNMGFGEQTLGLSINLYMRMLLRSSLDISPSSQSRCAFLATARTLPSRLTLK
jgi:hypothetical protein